VLIYVSLGKEMDGGMKRKLPNCNNKLNNI